jgi:hypothetical protein
MPNDDNSSKPEKQSTEQSQPCCPSASPCGDCPPVPGGNRENWKTLVFFVVLAAAGIVLVHSLAQRSNAVAEQPQQAFPTIADLETSEAVAQANNDTKEKTAGEAESALWGPELDSLAALDEVATDVDTVFIFICDKEQENARAAIAEIEAATKKIRSRGTRASAFRLSNDAVDYENLASQFSVPTVLAMVKGLGYSAVSEQITEVNLLEAFVTASRPQAGCCPAGTDPSLCGTAGCDTAQTE